jgi:hypothetical protein
MFTRLNVPDRIFRHALSHTFPILLILRKVGFCFMIRGLDNADQ